MLTIAMVIADAENEIPAILAPFDLTDNTSTFVTETHEDFLKCRRAIDENIIAGTRMASPDERYTPEAAKKRLAMGESDYFDAWVELDGCDTDEEGNIVISFNENGFHDGYVIDPDIDETRDVQGIRCDELQEDPGLMPEDTTFIVHDGEWEYAENVDADGLAAILRDHQGQRVWFMLVHN